MSTYKTKCDICGAVNEVPNYGEWDCCQCGQGYTYDEGHQIRLIVAQWALLPNQPRWISVEERLPEGDEPEAVLGWNGIRVREVVFCPRCKEGDQWSSFGGHEYVTHWMPMPEPPEVK